MNPLLRPCSRVGIDVTRRCNFVCKTCFYRWHPSFNAAHDEPIEKIVTSARQAQARGCDHVVLVGWGEPALWAPLPDFLREMVRMGMSTSIITNGSVSVHRYEEMRSAGLNHLHISVHGIGPVLDEIVGVEGAGARQGQVLSWLKKTDWPWRMNMTVQQANYKTLPDIASMCVEHGCKHIISLGFLPHYEWNAPDKLRQVAVHPAEIKPYIQAAGQIALDAGAMFTIRYHPMCLLDEPWRKYVVNAAYVLYDPWEWDYEHHGEAPETLWRSAQGIGDTVAIKEAPCLSCGARIHCGGWNRVYCAGFGRPTEILHAIDIPDKTPGWYHLQNPANLEKGIL